MKMKRILWPTDFSGSAEKALPYVTSLMNQYQTEVHVLYVIEDLGYHETWYGEFEENRIKKIHEWENKKAAERLEKICQNHLEGCPLYIRHVAIGDPAEEILKLAEKEQIDTIVMASRGRKGRFGFGSVAEKVVKNSAVPVVTIPAENNS